MQLNKKVWGIDDLVIHAHEAFEEKMVRVVFKVEEGGKVWTRYAFPELLPLNWAGREMCDLNYWLLDPKRFGLSHGRAKSCCKRP